MKKTYLLFACALCFGAMADTRLGKPLFVEDVTNEGGILNNLAQSNQVESVGAQVGVVDAILRAYINGELLEEVAAYMATHATNDVAHITAQERTAWNGKQDALPFPTNAIPADVIAGAPWLTTVAWDSVTGTPTIPTVPTAVSAFTNDVGYATTGQVAQALAGKAATNHTHAASAITDFAEAVAIAAPAPDLTSYYTKAEVDALVSNAVATAIANISYDYFMRVDPATTNIYYSIPDND